MIGHVKSIKMSGLAQKLSAAISRLRVDEMNAAAPFRVVSAVTSAIAQVPLLISPVVAFALFGVVAGRTGETLDATRLFAALSLIILQAQPLFWMFEVVLDMSSAMGCFKRIETYLSQAERTEYRVSAVGDERSAALGSGSATVADDGIELQELPKSGGPLSTSLAYSSDNAVYLQNASFSWTGEGPVVLSNISFNVKKAQLAMLIGPVASGKSTLLKGILGEVSHVQGRVYLSNGSHSWCEQSPWLTVRFLNPGEGEQG